jgi:hypothetical protein
MVRRKQALAATPGTGIGDKRAKEDILEPGAYGQIPRPPGRTHPPCPCSRCPRQECIPQRSCGSASGAAKAPSALGSLRSLGLGGSFLVCDGIAPMGVHDCLNCHIQAQVCSVGCALAMRSLDDACGHAG